MRAVSAFTLVGVVVFIYIYVYTYVFVHPIYYLRPSFSLSLLVVTQIRGHIADASPPSPLGFVPCIFIARRFQLFLPSSTRVQLCLPTVGLFLSELALFIVLEIRDNLDTNSAGYHFMRQPVVTDFFFFFPIYTQYTWPVSVPWRTSVPQEHAMPHCAVLWRPFLGLNSRQLCMQIAPGST